MNSRFWRKLTLFGLFIFAIIGVISLFDFFDTPPAAIDYPSYAEAYESRSSPPEKPDLKDILADDEPTERVELASLTGWNRVMCWPSVGGIIVNRYVSSVELDFLNLSRFEASPRSNNTSEEDEFCRQLRKTGAKWWESYADYFQAIDSRTRPISAKEREALLLGWPEDGGVWIMKETNWYNFVGSPVRGG
ncbi:hypothetical protein B7463_g11346, partial [Scytalidium lignicola]